VTPITETKMVKIATITETKTVKTATITETKTVKTATTPIINHQMLSANNKLLN